MPSYGSLHSPSLRKMNGNLEEGSSRERRGTGHSFRFGRTSKPENTDIADCPGHIVGDPFALATISIAYVGLPTMLMSQSV